MDSPLGYVSIYEMVFIFLITFLVVGPRRIIRGVKVINEWVRNRFRRMQKKATEGARKIAKANRAAKEKPATSKPKTSKKTQNVMRGFGRMVGYYRDLNKEKEKDKKS